MAPDAEVKEEDCSQTLRVNMNYDPNYDTDVSGEDENDYDTNFVAEHDGRRQNGPEPPAPA